MLSNLIIPSIVLFIIIYGFRKGIDIYGEFLIGVEEGLETSLKLFPTIFAIVLAIDVLIKSNLINDLIILIKPILQFLKFPEELFLLGFMRPISGSSSLVILNDLLKNMGPDSYIGRIASVIQGSTDTTIYIIGLYFSSIGVKKIKYSLIVGLMADIMAIILSVLESTKYFFGQYYDYYIKSETFVLDE